MDPFNDQITSTITQLEAIRDQHAGHAKAMQELQQLNDLARTNPDNITNLIFLGGTYLQMQQTNQAVQLLTEAVNNSKITEPESLEVAEIFEQIGYVSGFEAAIRKLVAFEPNAPEHRYNLAAIEAVTGRTQAALADLKMALDLNARRLATNPAAMDITKVVRTDPNLNSLRSLPEFQKLLPPQ
jgi:cytochrome c-type biogenesis protein CcmH/NrfG